MTRPTQDQGLTLSALSDLPGRLMVAHTHPLRGTWKCFWRHTNDLGPCRTRAVSTLPSPAFHLARASLGQSGARTLRWVLLTAGPLWDCGRAQSPPQASLAGRSHLSHWKGIEKRFGEAPFSFRVRYQPRSTGRPQRAPQFWPWSHLETKRWVHILKILMSPS